VGDHSILSFKGHQIAESSCGPRSLLQPEELRAVIQAAPAWLVPIVSIAVSTGKRRSQVSGLRWLDLDLEHYRIMLSQTKNGESRVVYLNKAAQAAIGSLEFDLILSLLRNFFRIAVTIR